MILRLVSGPMQEKSNGTGPLADRQKVLLTDRRRVSFFPGLLTTRGTGNFQKNFSRIPNIFGIPEFERFRRKFCGKIFRP